MRLELSAILALFLLQPFAIHSTSFVKEKGKVVGFWNIYAEGKHYQDIVNEQKRVIESSGLMAKLDKLYYTTMGEHGASLPLTGTKIKHLSYFGLHGSESQTLNEVYQHCAANSANKVLYFHNKGSLNYNIENTNFRRALDCFILNPRCLDALNKGFDTCGWRLSPLPHVHYSGNYWWATCKHINSLISPVVHTYNDTFLAYSAKLYPTHDRTTQLPSKDNPFPDQAYLGLGRYFAETWVSSAPMFQPADCINATMNNRYMWGKTPLPWRLVNKRCPNYKPDFMINTVAYSSDTNSNSHITSYSEMSESMKPLNYGLPCGIAGFIAQPKVVKKRFVLGSANISQEIRDRSVYWYGQPPKLLTAWMELYD